MWGDDLVRFAPMTGVFQASDRSWKLDDKSISDIELLRRTCASGALGTLLAPPVWYVSPAAFRAGWRAAPGHVSVVVLLDRARHAGRAAIDRTSEGAAALSVAEALIGAGERPGEPERGRLVLKVLEALQDVSAYEAGGAEPRAVARAMERELAA